MEEEVLQPFWREVGAQKLDSDSVPFSRVLGGIMSLPQIP